MRIFSPATEVRTIMRTDWSVKPTSEPLVLVALAAVSAVPQLPVHLGGRKPVAGVAAAVATSVVAVTAKTASTRIGLNTA
ncbi:hypothetical protein Rhe02_42490 [Rhizocola hellebori]|uniref:Uncharacterized protein n=1 Tax=Rhizocola hellebori TaxID=1392758 RepID=A0A8J3QA89_9ACTN|nr:hypothetical protein Rhe02_42490 [Rhizocola hellebori]